MFRDASILAVLLLATVLFGISAPAPPAHAQGETRTVNLDADWNLVSWTGPTTPIADALGPIVDAVISVHSFNNAGKTFDNYRSDGPAFLNTLAALGPGDPLWIRMSAPSAWEQAIVAVEGAVPLTAGFNLVSWLGSDNAPVDAAIGTLGESFTSLFAYDAATATFDRHAATAPAFVNTLHALPFGEGLWVLVSDNALWTGAAPSPSTSIPLADLSLVIDIPEGALPPGVSAADITATDVQLDDSSFTIAGTLVAVGDWPVLAAVELGPEGIEFGRPIGVSITVPWDGEGSPAAFPITDAALESIGSAHVDISVTDGTAAVRWQTTHFSTFAVIQGSVSVFAQNVGPIAVGESFTVPVTVSEVGGLPGLSVGPFAAFIDLLTPDAWLFEGAFNSSGPVSPMTVPDRPASREIVIGSSETNLYEAQFTCTEVGEFEIFYDTILDWAIEGALPEGLAALVQDLILQGQQTGRLVLEGTCTPEPIPPLDVAGVWDIEKSVTQERGACTGEVGTTVHFQITIEQEGRDLTVTGFDPTRPPWTGFASETGMEFGGSAQDGTGVTTAAYVLEMIDADRFEGTEFWTWAGPGGSCPDGLADIIAVRQA